MNTIPTGGGSYGLGPRYPSLNQNQVRQRMGKKPLDRPVNAPENTQPKDELIISRTAMEEAQLIAKEAIAAKRRAAEAEQNDRIIAEQLEFEARIMEIQLEWMREQTDPVLLSYRIAFYSMLLAQSELLRRQIADQHTDLLRMLGDDEERRDDKVQGSSDVDGGGMDPT